MNPHIQHDIYFGAFSHINQFMHFGNRKKEKSCILFTGVIVFQNYKMETDAEGNFSIYTQRPVTPEVINKVMKTTGIKSYDGMSQCLVSTKLDVIPGTVSVKDKYRDYVYGRFVTGTENSSFFQDGTLKLIGGCHVAVDGGHVAVISKVLAEKTG